MKKILHISKYYLPYYGGIEQVAYDIVSGLKDEYDQRVICFNHTKGKKKDTYEGVPVYRIDYLKKIASQAISFKYLFFLRKLIDDYSPDLIYFHAPNPLISIYLLCCNLKNKKLIIHWHSDIIDQKYLKLLYNPIQNLLLKISDKIFTTSPDYKYGSNDLKKYVSKVEVVPNVVNEAKFVLNDENISNIKKIKKKYGEYILFFLGRHVAYKGIEYIIKASSLIDEKAIILIAGEGPLSKKLQIMAHGKKNVIFLGKISNEEVKEYMFSSYLFLFPSITKNEAFGIALAEALYCGLPAVGFRIEGSGVNWVNKDGYTGFMVENKNVEEFAKKINILIENKNLRNKFSENAKEWVTNNFKKEKMIEILKIEIKKLIESKG